MERKIIWLIVASTLLMGILLWSKRDAQKRSPRFSPTIDVRTACDAQKQQWCDLVMPDGATSAEKYRCMYDYMPRCVGCLVTVEQARQRGEPNIYAFATCPALQDLKDTYRRPEGPAPQPAN